MTAITLRKPARPLEVLIRITNGTFLRVPAEVFVGRHERAPEKGRTVRKLLRDLVALKQRKKK